MQVTMGLRRPAQILKNQIGILDGAVRQTWGETQDRVARLAGALQRLGLKPGDRVAILALNSFRYFELYYAVPWAAGAVMPLNIRLAPNELAAQLTDAEPFALVVDDAFAKVLPVLAEQVPSIRTVIHAGAGPVPAGALAYETLVAEGPAVADANVGGDETYGLFYTGGTTAASKGVMLTHDNICINAYNVALTVDYGPEDVYLHAAPMFHVADGASTFAITMLGAVHAFIPLFDPEKWARAVQEYRVTKCLIVPTMINALVNCPEVAKYDLGSLQRILYGASPISAELLSVAKKKLPCKLQQGYGMTETSPVLTMLPHEDHQLEGPRSHRIKSAGFPVPNVEVAVLDEKDQEVPRGTIGEICARGPIVMKGYWRKPEETSRAIRNGYMHTGDLGYMDEDGYVYLVDRAKDMIVSGGENVYSVEVEAALYAHPAVLEAAVFGIPHDVLGEQVHAIVVPKNGQEVSAETLMTHCRTLIAGYKCPKSIAIQTELLPKSGAGKILKRALRAQYWKGLERQIH
jgi:long-chain acyl-CoA synthetase